MCFAKCICVIVISAIISIGIIALGVYFGVVRYRGVT